MQSKFFNLSQFFLDRLGPPLRMGPRSLIKGPGAIAGAETLRSAPTSLARSTFGVVRPRRDGARPIERDADRIDRRPHKSRNGCEKQRYASATCAEGSSAAPAPDTNGRPAFLSASWHGSPDDIPGRRGHSSQNFPWATWRRGQYRELNRCGLGRVRRALEGNCRNTALRFPLGAIGCGREFCISEALTSTPDLLPNGCDLDS